MSMKIIKIGNISSDFQAFNLPDNIKDIYLTDIIVDGVSLAAAGLPPFTDGPINITFEFNRQVYI